jgi:hypothetical protein
LGGSEKKETLRFPCSLHPYTGVETCTLVTEREIERDREREREKVIVCMRVD